MNSELRHLPGGVVPTSVAEAYAAVLHIANIVLRNCRLFSIETLQEENPSINQIAQGMHVICDIMEILAKMDHLADQTIPAKAREYATHIRLIAEAVDRGDHIELNRQVHELNQRSFL